MAHSTLAIGSDHTTSPLSLAEWMSDLAEWLTLTLTMDTIITWLLRCNEKLLNDPSEQCFIGYLCTVLNALEHTAEERTGEPVIMLPPTYFAVVNKK